MEETDPDLGSRSVLVTGSSGTIGTALVERLLAADVDVRGVDREPNQWSTDIERVTDEVDLLAPDAGERLPPDVDVVVHLAAHSRVRELVEDPMGAEENLRTLVTVLEHARETGADVIFASSREVYGDQSATVYEEADAGLRAVENPYGASKAGGEALLTAYRECYGVRTCSLRLSNVYGRYDRSDRVVPLFIALASRGEDLTVYGDDKLLDFLHIDDCVRAFVQACERIDAVQGEVMNVGSGRGHSLEYLAEMIVSRLDTDVSVTVEANRQGEVDRFVADVTRARQLLGFETEYSLPEGLDEAVAWYSDHQAVLDELAG